MKMLTNFPIYNSCTDEFGGMAGLAKDVADAGLDGLEVIWDHMPYTEEMPSCDLVVGYHLLFFACWLDFWNGNWDFLMREYENSRELVHDYYHGFTQEEYLDCFRVDLQRAIDLEAEYTVFHVSEVSLTECFTYDFAHSDKEVIDGSLEVINRLLDGSGFKGAFLVENQWWPGLTFTDPKMTKYLLDGIEYDNKGIMLDTGHLCSTNTSLRTQADAAAYLDEMCKLHGPELVDYVRGLHFHQSLSGEYVEGQGYKIPDDFEGTYWEKYSRCYSHIVQIDRHQPWTEPAVAPVVEAIAPEWINSELSAWPREPHLQALATQLDTLRRGGLEW